MTYRESEQNWLARNPIKQWRTAQNLFLKDIAGFLKLNYHTVWRWETGMAFPNVEQGSALSKMMKNKKVLDELQSWMNERPSFGKGGRK